MNTIKAIQARRSCRKFKNKKPNWRDIIEAIDSASYAPMAGNFFSLKFILVNNKETINKIANWSEQEFIQEAQYVVAIISTPRVVEIPFPQKAEKYMRQQAGAAIQNFMLHLTDAGLSTCWIGHFNEEKIKQILKIPENQDVEALFPVGYPKEKIKTKKGKGAITDYLFYEEWGNKRMKKIEKIESRSPIGY